MIASYFYKSFEDFPTYGEVPFLIYQGDPDREPISEEEFYEAMEERDEEIRRQQKEEYSNEITPEEFLQLIEENF